MRPLALLCVLVALLFPACQSGPGPSIAMDVQPAVGASGRVFAGPQDGIGASARVELGTYGFRTGKAAEPSPVAAPTVAAPCSGGACPVAKPDPLRVHEAPAPDAGRQP